VLDTDERTLVSLDTLNADLVAFLKGLFIFQLDSISVGFNAQIFRSGYSEGSIQQVSDRCYDE